ncbi:hypothetical protein CSHISOI_03348 [Colletotrichum shisoi]|uniref:Uncharacterized protein n=1 Tax=Colletotrichum shisoi TaxID=2078593 RepID=A0A5Q4BYH8_9PEZI|nr:hypothetical protein CSHISOI_03348 [Colletotrichum shisoi]
MFMSRTVLWTSAINLTSHQEMPGRRPESSALARKAQLQGKQSIRTRYLDNQRSAAGANDPAAHPPSSLSSSNRISKARDEAKLLHQPSQPGRWRQTSERTRGQSCCLFSHVRKHTAIPAADRPQLVASLSCSPSKKKGKNRNTGTSVAGMSVCPSHETATHSQTPSQPVSAQRSSHREHAVLPRRGSKERGSRHVCRKGAFCWKSRDEEKCSQQQ